MLFCTLQNRLHNEERTMADSHFGFIRSLSLLYLSGPLDIRKQLFPGGMASVEV